MPSTHATTAPSKTSRLIRRARISSSGVRSRSFFFFATRRDDCFGTRDVYYGVSGDATSSAIGPGVTTQPAGRFDCDCLALRPVDRECVSHECETVFILTPLRNLKNGAGKIAPGEKGAACKADQVCPGLTSSGCPESTNDEGPLGHRKIEKGQRLST